MADDRPAKQGLDWEALKARLEAATARIDDDFLAADSAALLTSRAQRYARPLEHADTSQEEAVVFARGGIRYAAMVADLAEIRPIDSLTPIPGIAATIVGVLNVRGRMVATHDLSAVRGEAVPVAEQSWALVAGGGLEDMALLADEIEAITNVPADSLRPPPMNLALPRHCYAGVTSDGCIVLKVAGLAATPSFFQAREA